MGLTKNFQAACTRVQEEQCEAPWLSSVLPRHTGRGKDLAPCYQLTTELTSKACFRDCDGLLALPNEEERIWLPLN